MLHWQPEGDWPLRVWANRDEFLARPSAPVAPWDDAPQVLAGRDLQAGGTWLGVTHQGRFAGLTNFRDAAPTPARRSRGALVSGFLAGRETAADAARRIHAESADYGGFNLLLSDGNALWITGHGEQGPEALMPGWHGLSNARLNTPWPKVERLKQAARATAGDEDPAHHLALLADETRADDDRLPDTGVGLDMERLLSPICIRSAGYGTRNSTWLRIGRDEIRWDEQDHGLGQRIQHTLARQR